MSTHRAFPKTAGFRLGIYVCKDAEIVDFAAPHGVFSVARRFDPELDAFRRRGGDCDQVQAQAGFTVAAELRLQRRGLDMDAFLIPGGFGTRQETQQRAAARLHPRAAGEDAADERVHRLMDLRRAWACSTASPRPTARSRIGLKPPTSARCRSTAWAEIAPNCRISRARVVDAGRIVTGGGIASGMEMGFHLLRRAGYDEAFISEVARVMEYAGGLRPLPRRHRIRGLMACAASSRRRAAEAGGEHIHLGGVRAATPSASHGAPWRRSG